MKRLLLISFVILCLASYGQGQRYVKVIGKELGKRLDSVEVSFYQIAGAEFCPIGGSAITDTNGLVQVPPSISTDSSVFYKINANPLKMTWDHRRFYGPTVKNIKGFATDTLIIEADMWLACRPIRPQDIYFAENRSEIIDFFSQYLKENYLPKLASNPDWTAEIHGNADPNTEHDLAEKIARARAKAIQKWLIKNGIKKSRLLITNDADNIPVARCTNGKDCEEANSSNRRVRIFLIPSKTEE